MKRSDRRLLAGLLAAGLLTTACGSDSDASSGAGPDPADGGAGPADNLPTAIECGTQYRPDAEQMTGAESPTLRVERTGDTAAVPTTHEFPTMSLEVTYTGDAPEGRTVRVDVTTAAGDLLARQLYQIGTPLEEIAFAGDHGFTGLTYVHHGEAMLQVWCEAV